MPVLRIAAAVVLLTGIAGILYVILRSPSQELITQEIPKKEKPAPQMASPSVAQPAEKDIEPSGSSVEPKDIGSEKQAKTEVLAENREEMILAEQENEVEGIKAEETPPPPIEYRQKAAEAVSRAMPPEKSDITYITGKVVGIDGVPLPGVSIMEKGTSHGVITDIDGNFSIQVGDTGSELLLSYVGYEPLELNAGDIAGKPITMQENLMALDEVVVVGYGTKKKSDQTGAISRLEAKDISPGGAVDSYAFVNPVPPGGNIKAFKNWVNERIDSTQFKSFPGKHRMQVILTVQQDGHINDIRIRSNAPSPVVDEYKKVLNQSPLWKPALKDDEPVDAEVVIRFVLTVN